MLAARMGNGELGPKLGEAFRGALISGCLDPGGSWLVGEKITCTPSVGLALPLSGYLLLFAVAAADPLLRLLLSEGGGFMLAG